MDPKNMNVSYVLAELTAGKASVAVRYGQDDAIEVLEGWEDLDPHEAARIVTAIAKGEITAEEVAKRPHHPVCLVVKEGDGASEPELVEDEP